MYPINISYQHSGQCKGCAAYGSKVFFSLLRTAFLMPLTITEPTTSRRIPTPVRIAKSSIQLTLPWRYISSTYTVVYLIILRHLMEHGFFFGCCVPDIACGQLIAGTQHEIIVKVDADIGAVLQRSQVVAVVVSRRQEPKQEAPDRACGIGHGDIFRNDNYPLCLAV